MAMLSSFGACDKNPEVEGGSFAPVIVRQYSAGTLFFIATSARAISDLPSNFRWFCETNLLFIIATMLAASSRRYLPRLGRCLARAQSTQVEGASDSNGEGPIGEDGRHELWREGQSSDHDNEPR